MNGVKTTYIYDAAGELLSEIDGTSGATKRNYVWLDGAPLAILESSSVYFMTHYWADILTVIRLV